MATIWKFPLNIVGKQEVSMPIGATILTAQTQGNTVCLWAEIPDSSTKTEKRTIIIVGTGHEFDNTSTKYIATAQTAGGSLVWHIYEKR